MEKTTKQEKNEERKWNRILVNQCWSTSRSLDPSKTCSPPFKQLQVGISCQAHQMHLSMHLMFLCTCQWQLFGGTSKSCFVRDLGRFPLGREFLTQQEPNFSQQQKITTNGSLTSEQNTPWSCKFKFKKQISKKHTKQKKCISWPRLITPKIAQRAAVTRNQFGSQRGVHPRRAEKGNQPFPGCFFQEILRKIGGTYQDISKKGFM